MAVVTVSGEPGCRTREVAQLAAQRLGFTHLSAERLEAMLEEEFGADALHDARNWADMAGSLLLRAAVSSHLVIGVDGAERIFRNFPALFRVRIVAPAARRIGNLMLDDGLDRAAARVALKQRENQLKAARKSRFGQATAPPASFDIVLNSETLDGAQMAALIASGVEARNLTEHGYLSPAAEAQMQFQIRLRLARHGIEPRGVAGVKQVAFGHPSEKTFASLLDFYRIPWEYEPRSFPIAWDQQGRVLESFTPDFYLPESDLYVELTTMKQSLVTKKNRKIRLLREIYPQIRIQVFYQKDLEEMVLKYSLAEEKVQP
ncbi:MAG: cytidylate kinase family protein [Bryobacteraceae bacterium]|nr:cytidylate kinase family protein [Bryobacteraceae bacterium]